MLRIEYYNRGKSGPKGAYKLHRHEGVCGECGKIKKVTKDYRGNPICTNCFLNLL